MGAQLCATPRRAAAPGRATVRGRDAAATAANTADAAMERTTSVVLCGVVNATTPTTRNHCHYHNHHRHGHYSGIAPFIRHTLANSGVAARRRVLAVCTRVSTMCV